MGGTDPPEGQSESDAQRQQREQQERKQQQQVQEQSQDNPADLNAQQLKQAQEDRRRVQEERKSQQGTGNPEAGCQADQFESPLREEPRHGRHRQGQEHRAGTAGKAKEAAGKVTDDESLEAQGQTDQTEADVKQTGEDVKDIFRG